MQPLKIVNKFYEYFKYHHFNILSIPTRDFGEYFIP